MKKSLSKVEHFWKIEETFIAAMSVQIAQTTQTAQTTQMAPKAESCAIRSHVFTELYCSTYYGYLFIGIMSQFVYGNAH